MHRLTHSSSSRRNQPQNEVTTSIQRCMGTLGSKALRGFIIQIQKFCADLWKSSRRRRTRLTFSDNVAGSGLLIHHSLKCRGARCKIVPLERETKALLWRLPSQVTLNYEYAHDRSLASQAHN